MVVESSPAASSESVASVSGVFRGLSIFAVPAVAGKSGVLIASDLTE
ncbi:hypothetical protein [Paenibacillus sp. FSL K6-1230]